MGEQWNMEQVSVPQQDEGESCGYRMLSNLNKVMKGQEIRREKEKEHNRLYYYRHNKKLSGGRERGGPKVRNYSRTGGRNSAKVLPTI